MKKILLFVLILVLSLSVCACREKPAEPTTETGTVTTTGAPAETENATDVPEEEHEHEYVQTVVEADCTNEGYTIHTCKCGDTYISDEVAAAGHTWLDATCTEPMTCAICGAKEGTAIGHSYVDGVCEICGAA